MAQTATATETGDQPVAKAVDEVDEVASGGSKGGTIYELDPWLEAFN